MNNFGVFICFAALAYSLLRFGYEWGTHVNGWILIDNIVIFLVSSIILGLHFFTFPN